MYNRKVEGPEIETSAKTLCTETRHLSNSKPYTFIAFGSVKG